MRLVQRTTLSVVLALLFAGCLGGSDVLGADGSVERISPLEGSPGTITKLEERLGRVLAPVGGATVRDWYVMATNATPNATLTGFQWTVPAGGIIPVRTCCTGVVLEIMPVVASDAPISEWCLLVFRDLAGQMVSINNRFHSDWVQESRANDRGAFCRHTEHRTTIDHVAGTTKEETIPASLGGMYVMLTDPTIQELTDLYFVMAAKSAVPTGFGLAFRVVTEYPQGYDVRFPSPNPPVATLEEFLVKVGPDQPRAVQPLGSGSGFHGFRWTTTMGIQEWGNISLVSPNPSANITTTSSTTSNESTPKPVVDQRAVGAVWDFNITSEFKSAGGWDLVLVDYLGACSHGRYAWSVDAHGPTTTRQGVVANGICGGLVVTYLAFGNSEFVVSTGGDGGSGRAHFEMQMASPVWDELEFHHVSLGTPLEELLFKPHGETIYWDGGALGRSVGNTPIDT